MRDWMQLLETEILEEEAARENLEARVSALERKLEAMEAQTFLLRTSLLKGRTIWSATKALVRIGSSRMVLSMEKH